MRPDIIHVGGVLYWTLQTRNPDTQVLKDADSTPTVAVRKNGAAVGDSVTIIKRSATTGLYDCSYNPAAEVEGDTFQFEESATVTGTTTSSATYVNQFSVRAVHAGAVELDSATQTQVTNIENASGYLLAVLAGACADPQTATETYAITTFGSTFTVALAGLTSTGTRTAPTLTKT
jgi:hypothetical protein